MRAGVVKKGCMRAGVVTKVLMENCVDRAIIIAILWSMVRGSAPRGPAISESLNPVAFFRFAKVHLLHVDLFDHKNRKILQGVAFGIKMITVVSLKIRCSNFVNK